VIYSGRIGMHIHVQEETQTQSRLRKTYQGRQELERKKKMAIVSWTKRQEMGPSELNIG
jgi:hypothetical protein